MKKLIALLICFAICFSFTSCGSPDKEITIPASFFEGTEITQEDINEINDGNYKSATINDDGSLTLVMTDAQHKELMDGLKKEMQSSFDELINDDTYSFVAITPNNNYTEFKVEVSTETVGFADMFSVLVFYTYGGMYNTFNGTPADNISVVFVNSNGDVIETANSSEMGE